MKRAALVFVAACGGPSGGAPDAAVVPSPARVAVISWVDTRALDVVFVIDDSAGMVEAQDALAAAFPAFAEGLTALEGALPDLHVGVVSSDLGAGAILAGNCNPGGHGGQLQACATATAPYLVDVSDGAGGRTTNYAGTLAEAFACNAALGSEGCGFEQHLGALGEALDGTNGDFRRPGAHLQVIVLADEDDCSAHDLGVFTALENDVLGPQTSFRCFEFGVACDAGNDDPRAPGVRDGCHPEEDSPYLEGVAGYAALLREVAGGTQALASVIVGDPSPVEVVADPEQPTRPVLLPSCISPIRGRADPGVRLDAFASAFRPHGAFHSICDDDLSPAMREIGTHAAEAIATTCLVGDLAGSLADLEARCTVRDVTGLDTAAEQTRTISRCADDPSPPCFRFEADDRCAFNAADASLAVDRAAAPPAGTLTVVECSPT